MWCKESFAPFVLSHCLAEGGIASTQARHRCFSWRCLALKRALGTPFTKMMGRKMGGGDLRRWLKDMEWACGSVSKRLGMA